MKTDAFDFTQKRTQPLVSSGLSKSIPSHRDSFKKKEMSLIFTNECLAAANPNQGKVIASKGAHES